eukprot:1149306-Pelagomonas_calceolata.AAC.4
MASTVYFIWVPHLAEAVQLRLHPAALHPRCSSTSCLAVAYHAGQQLHLMPGSSTSCWAAAAPHA